MILPASYSSGFAPRDGQPLYPELWRGCDVCLSPSLGPTGSTLRDWSGYGRHGVLTNGPTWQLNRGNYSVDIDATDDKIVLPPISFTTSFSLSIWALSRRSSTISVNSPDIFSTRGLGVSGLGLHGFTLGRNGSTTANLIVAYVEQTSGSFFAPIYDSQFVENQLAHWVMLFDRPNGTVSLYKNGVLLTPSSTTSSGSLANQDIGSATEAVIGNRPNTTLRPLDGYFDDVRIYRRMISVSEIKILGLRRGIAYELAPRRRSSVLAAFNRRRRLLLGST